MKNINNAIKLSIKLFEDQLKYTVNPVAKTLKDPKYRSKVVPDKTKYNRKKTIKRKE